MATNCASPSGILSSDGTDTKTWLISFSYMMKHQQLKVSLAVLAAVGTGVGVPVYAVVFQQKTASA